MLKTSITDKLVVYFVLLSGIAVSLVGYLSYQNSKDALFKRTFDQLTSVRVVKKRQIENFFRDRTNEINIFSQLEQVSDIIYALDKLELNKTANNSVQGFDERNKSYAGLLRKMLEVNKYYERFILLPVNKNIALNITNQKGEQDISLIKLDDTTIGELKQQITKDKRTIISENISKTNDSNYTIALAAPVLNKANEVLGILLFEINPQNVTKIMLENNPQEGLGLTGESYIIGKDFYLRSQSRFIAKSVLQTKVQTNGATEALSGKEGTDIYRDYRNIEVLGSFTKLNVPGLDWYLLAEIDYSEADLPITKMRNSILILTIIIAAIVFIVTFVFSKRITVPLVKLTSAAKRISDGIYGQHIAIKSKDEIGTLTSTFNMMTNKLKIQEAEIKKERLKRSSAAMDAMENERKRLSRELHDGLGQTLIAMKLKLENIDLEKPDRTLRIIREVKKAMDNTVNEIRHISNDLMPAVLNDFGVVNAIRNLCQDLNEFSHLDIEFISDFHLENLDNRLQIYIFRITQEALNNVIQHASANKAKVELKFADNFINLVISDNGMGFKPENVIEGNGIINIRERANLLNGECRIKSKLNIGTEIVIKIPYRV